MRDQAHRLRELVLQSPHARVEPDACPPSMLVVSGGKGGVGVTTVAVNLAVHWALEGRQVVLVDANLNQPDVATLCGLEERTTLCDVLDGRRTVQEALQKGPAGVRILCGRWATQTAGDFSAPAQLRLVEQLRRLGPRAEMVVVDAGSGKDAAVHRFWYAATRVVLVLTPDQLALMDAYAAIKVASSRHAAGGNRPLPSIVTVVNRCEAADACSQQASSQQAQERLRSTCRRFLDVRIESGARIASDPAVVGAEERRQPLMIADAGSRAAKAVAQLARQVLPRAAEHYTNVSAV